MAHSLASSTGTRVDSASKHNVPCRMATDYLKSLISSSHADNADRELQNNKHKYCMGKDDIVIGLGRPVFGKSAYYSKKKAYPSVITSLAQMEPEARAFIAFKNFFCSSYEKVKELGTTYKENLDDKIKDESRKKAVISQIEHMLDIYVVGVALTTAWAHPCTGDTVGTVMIGGLRTVINGHFPVHTNDPLCIYFDNELVYFEEDGSRKNREEFRDTEKDLEDLQGSLKNPEKDLSHLTKKDKALKMYQERGNGNYPATVTQGRFDGKMHIARIKPYIVSKHLDIRTGNPQHFPMDKRLIFAKAISNALPFEKLDIMICRQSL